MNKIKIISIVFALGILLLLGLLFIPRSYEVQAFKERNEAQYWNLETGSRIGYTRIETEQQNKKSPIIYLHGGPGGKITDHIIASLKSVTDLGHDLYFYDQIGSGHSARLDDISEYTVERHRRDLEAIIDKIGSHKVILLGHSWGSCLAINYLQHDPERIEKMILTGPGPILPINISVLDEKPPAHLGLIAPEFSNRDGNKKANNWRSRFFSKWAQLFKSKLASDQEADAFFTYLNHELSKSTDCVLNEARITEGGGGYYSHLMTFNSVGGVVDNRNELKEMETPMLILRGQCDNQHWGYSKEYLDLFENAELKIIAGAGHAIVNTAQSEYYELIDAFLKE